jgi:hypothetical protein
MSVQLELLKSLHADFMISANKEMGVLHFKSKIIEICSILASYSFCCERKFITQQLKITVDEISQISRNACKSPMIGKVHVQDVMVCLEVIMMLVRENEAISKRKNIQSYSEVM